MKDVYVFFTSAAFKWEAVALCIDLLYCNFEKWKKQLRGNKSCQFRPPKVAKKEVSLLELSKYKSTLQREVGC